jgi:predicted O-methyltransferase YrrM
MPHITHPLIAEYLVGLRSPRDKVLREMERIATRRGFPIIGPDVGTLLYILTKISGAKRVLELGSGYGYSAYWFARALPPDGEVICTDTDSKNRDQAVSFFERAGLAHKLHYEVGDALAILDKLAGPFDIIFNDVDKEDYPRVVEQVAPKLRDGGLFITDNTLWSGLVANQRQDATTRAVVEFNRLVARHPLLVSLNLPLRDGLTVCLKTG